MPTVGGLVVRHFSWRSREQYVRKIANGSRAYQASGYGPEVGGHWQMWGVPPDDLAELAEWEQRVGDHFETWFYSSDPASDGSLIFDPSPVC